MPVFDPRSFILTSFFVFVLFVIILLALYRTLPNAMAGFKEGVGASVMWAIGGGLIVGRNIIPDIASIYLGNIALSSGILLMYAALSGAVAGRIPSKAKLALMLLSFAIVLGVSFTAKNYPALLVVITLFNTVVFALCLATIWRMTPAYFSSRFTIFILIFATAISGTRLITLIVHIESPSNLFGPALFQKVYTSGVAFSIVGILLGYTLITYERIRGLLLDANTSLETEVAARTADLTMEIETKQVLERRLLSIAEAERRRIGHELHDDLGQRLTGISLVAELLSNSLSKSESELIRHADAIGQAASDAITQVRSLAHGLMPVGPGPDGFSEALDQLARETSVANLVCRFEYDEPVDIKNQDLATNLFRIAQQAINNAIKHARATTIIVRLDVVDDLINLSIADDGIGFAWPRPDTEVESGRGMGIMAFRASLIQYRLHVESTAGKGSLIKVLQC